MIIRGKTVVLAILGLSVLTLAVLLGYGLSMGDLGGPIIGLIHIDDVIGREGSRPFVQGQVSFLDQLRAAERDMQIHGLLLRINSPGGSSGMSQELFHTVRRISNNGVPVVVSMGDIATSGGYYLAAAADYVFANGATLTGSIGVIMEFTNYQELYEKIGLDVEVIASGDFKDAGHRRRPLRPQDEELFSSIVFDAWDQFVEDVALARAMPREDIESIADGRIITGRQALNLNLIDELGGYEEALTKLKELAYIDGPVGIRTYRGRMPVLSRLLNYTQLPHLLELLQEPSVRLLF